MSPLLPTRRVFVAILVFVLTAGVTAGSAHGLQPATRGAQRRPSPRWYCCGWLGIWPCPARQPAWTAEAIPYPRPEPFHWGYFGAGRYRQAVHHISYYGDYMQWSFRWGY